MGVHHAVIGRRMERLPATGMVGERLRSGTSRKTTPREDRLTARYARINRFATSTRILDEVNFGSNVSVRTVDIRINEQRSRKDTHKMATTVSTSSVGSMELVTLPSPF